MSYNPDQIKTEREDDGETVSMKFDDYDRLVSEYWKCKGKTYGQPDRIIVKTGNKLNLNKVKKWLIFFAILLGIILFIIFLIWGVRKIIKSRKSPKMVIKK